MWPVLKQNGYMYYTLANTYFSIFKMIIENYNKLLKFLKKF